MRIVLAGASGFLGGRLAAVLTAAGHELTTLVRRPPSGPDEVQWDPDAGRFDESVLDGAAAVVNLCGAGVGDHRWTDAYKQTLLTSRVRPTSLLADGCARAGVPVLLNASGIGCYGDTGDAPVAEDAPFGRTFLARVCRQWEAATRPASVAGTRVVLLRSGLVLGNDGGLVPRLRVVYRLFAGGKLGSGRQYFPWVSVTDEIGAIVHALDGDVDGPMNIVGPEQVTNAEFSTQFARALNRPAPWRVPAFALHAALGEFAEELLGGQRAVPAVLERTGFAFTHPTLAQALAAELGEARAAD